MRRVALSLLFLMLLTFPAFGKSLHWASFDVDARLDADGKLHVVERHRMVFDGDWNGGERSFVVRRGQRLTLNRITRNDGTREIPLVKGDLDEVDRYDWWSGDTLRWRSRLPSDPPFANKAIDYTIDYTFSNILTASEDGSSFLLSHDFGLPQRESVIQRASLRLTIDPIWGVPSPPPVTHENLAPGESLIVSRTLHYGGKGAPQGIEKPIAPWMQYAALGLFLAGVIVLISGFRAAERGVGRFAPVSARVDDAILQLPAEVAGAVWDAGIGAPEVAAVLARMTQERKLTSRVEEKVLHLKLEVDRRSLRGYERELVSGLFFDGNDVTDTAAVKAHYRSRGFDPAGLIRDGIEKQLDELPQWSEKVKRFSGVRDTLFLLASLLLVAAAAWFDRDAIPGCITTTIFSAVFGLFAAASAYSFSKSITHLGRAFLAPALFYAVACAPFLFVALYARRLAYDASVLFALALWMLALLNLVLDQLKIRNSPQKIDYRKKAAGTRLYFIEQLGQQTPALRDEWFPYVLAFGLGKNVDRWFRTSGGASTSTTGSWGSATSSSSGASGTSWSGGGGAFGGAGAAGSWAVAAGAIASGVASPSSSSSGGGGGGSSSGGGGGGGW